MVIDVHRCIRENGQNHFFFLFVVVVVVFLGLLSDKPSYTQFVICAHWGSGAVLFVTHKNVALGTFVCSSSHVKNDLGISSPESRRLQG